MRKLIGGLFIVTCMVLMSGCGNHSLGPGNYTFKHIHLTDSVKGHCATVESWRDDDVGIEVKTKEYGPMFLSEGSYILFSDGGKCPYCK
jgi:hypothetical protein